MNEITTNKRLKEIFGEYVGVELGFVEVDSVVDGKITKVLESALEGDKIMQGIFKAAAENNIEVRVLPLASIQAVTEEVKDRLNLFIHQNDQGNMMVANIYKYG